MLTQWFDPEPTFKGLAFARALVRMGHEVEVITGFPNYPGGKVYPGHRLRPWKHEIVSNIPITRVLLYPSHGRSALGRILNYGTFAFSATLAGIFSRFRADVIYVYHPPLTVGLAASVIGFFRRVPFVYDIQDLWPDTLSATGMISSRPLLAIVGQVALWVYGRATLLVAQSPGFVTRLIDRGVPQGKIRLIYNWCDEEALSSSAEESMIEPSVFGDHFNVVFAGNMGRAQGLQAVLDSAEMVASVDPRIQFVFVGGGTEVDRLKARARASGLDSVVFLPRVAVTQIARVLDAADVLLVHLRDDPLFSITLPSKTQAYLYAAKPILMGVRGDAADLVTRADAGLCVSPEDPGALAEAVVRLASLPPSERIEMGARGRRFYDEVLSLDSGTRQMIETFEEAVITLSLGVELSRSKNERFRS